MNYSDINPNNAEAKSGKYELSSSKDQLKEIKEKLKLNEQRFEALLKLNKMSNSSINEIMDYVLEIGVKLTCSKIGYIYFYDDEKEELILYSWSKDVMKECKIMNPQTIYQLSTTGLWGEAVRQRKPIITNDYSSMNSYKKGLPKGHVSLNRHMNVPIFYDEKIVALIGVGNKDSNYDESDIRHLTLLMNEAWEIVKRREMDEKLKESEERFRSTFEQAAVGICHATLEGKFVRVNKKFCDIVGYTEEELLNLTFHQITHPDDLQKDLKYAHELIENKIKTFSMEKRYFKKKGSPIWINITVSIMYDLKGKPQNFIGVIEDVTKRKKAEEEITASERLYRTLIENLPQKIFFKDKDSVYLSCNSSYAKDLNIKTQQIIGKSDYDFFSKELSDKYRNDDKRVLLSGKTEELEEKYTKEGKEFWVNTVKTPIKDENGNVTGIIGIFWDITKHKRAEQRLKKYHEHLEQLVDTRTNELQQSRERLRAQYKGIPIPTYTWKKIKNDFVLIDYNDGAEKVTKGKIKNLLGTRAYKFYKDIPDIFKHMSRCFFSKEAVEEEITYEIKSTGECKYFSVKYAFVPPNLILVHTEDITKRKQAEEALKKAKEDAEKADRTKSEFIANMSHEIRTPLNAVIGFSEILSNVVSDEKQREYVESIKIAGKSLLNLINDILDLSKIEADMMKIEYSPVNIIRIFREIEQIFKTKIYEKNLQWIISIKEDLPSVLILDETRLRQVLLNLVGNAVKFTDKGYIKVSARTLNNKQDNNRKLKLIITVEDTGIGVPLGEQERIFESFRQQSGQSNRKYGGTGLGLSISKKLTEMMNGEISLRSTVGVGSIFTIILHDVDISISEVPSEEREYSVKSITDDKHFVESDKSEAEQKSNKLQQNGFESNKKLKKLKINDIENFPELLRKITEEVYPIINELGGAIKITAVNRLGDTAITLGERYIVDDLYKCGKKIKKAAERYDIININKYLKDMYEIINNLIKLGGI